MSAVEPKPPALIDITALPRTGSTASSGEPPADVVSLCEYISTTERIDPGAGFPSHSVLGGESRLEQLRQHCEQASIELDPSVLPEEGALLVREWQEAFRELDIEDQERIGTTLKRLFFS